MGLSVYGKMEADDEDEWDLFRRHDRRTLRGVVPARCNQAHDGDGMGRGGVSGTGRARRHGSPSAFDHLSTRFPRLRAAVYWHERWQNANTMFYSNLRVNSSPAALEAYRKGVAAPFWLSEPIYH